MLWTGLSRYVDHGLLLLRLGFGLGFAWFHGLPKLLGGTERWAGVGGAMESVGVGFGAGFFGLAAGLVETFGALAFAAGFLFRPMSALLMFVMIVATSNHIYTGQGTMAHSFKNIWVFAGMILIGPGRFSVDHWLERRRSERVRAGGPQAARVEAAL